MRTGMGDGQVVGRQFDPIHPDDVEVERAIAPAFVAFPAVVLFNAGKFGQECVGWKVGIY
jgi:hypothetical protein